MKKLLLPLVAGALALTAVPVSAAPGPHTTVQCHRGPSAPASTVPALNPDALCDALSGIPNAEVSGALVRVSGTAGSWRGSGGVARINTRQPVPVDGRFRIGSITKLFTATAALQLDGRGVLDLDQTVQHYLPGLLTPDFKPITVRQLLDHTHGIAGFDLPHKEAAWFLEHRFDTWNPVDVVRMGVERGPRFDPGDRQEYGNMGYLVAGLVIEEVTGKPYADSIREGIIRPLGLHDTSLPGTDTRIRGPHAHGYEFLDGEYVDITEANPSLQWAASEMISSARDLDRFLDALLRGDLLTGQQRDEMMTLPTPDAVHGLGITRIPLGGGLVVWGKSGDRPGYNNGVAGTLDGARTLVYSANTLKMGGDQPEAAVRIITAAFS